MRIHWEGLLGGSPGRVAWESALGGPYVRGSFPVKVEAFAWLWQNLAGSSGRYFITMMMPPRAFHLQSAFQTVINSYNTHEVSK